MRRRGADLARDRREAEQAGDADLVAEQVGGADPVVRAFPGSPQVGGLLRRRQLRAPSAGRAGMSAPAAGA